MLHYITLHYIILYYIILNKIDYIKIDHSRLYIIVCYMTLYLCILPSFGTYTHYYIRNILYIYTYHTIDIYPNKQIKTIYIYIHITIIRYRPILFDISYKI